MAYVYTPIQHYSTNCLQSLRNLRSFVMCFLLTTRLWVQKQFFSIYPINHHKHTVSEKSHYQDTTTFQEMLLFIHNQPLAQSDNEKLKVFKTAVHHYQYTRHIHEAMLH